MKVNLSAMVDFFIPKGLKVTSSAAESLFWLAGVWLGVVLGYISLSCASNFCQWRLLKNVTWGPK